MTRPALVWEPCAGSAALSRALVGAPRRLVPWLGGKARLAPVLLAALGLRRGAPHALAPDPRGQIRINRCFYAWPVTRRCAP